MKKATYEVIKWPAPASKAAEWLSGPVAGQQLHNELNYLLGLYGRDSLVSYLPSPIAKRMAADGRLQNYRKR